MFRITIASTILFLITRSIHAQPDIEWERLYGENGADEFSSHIRTEQGGWAFTGHQNFHFWLLVTDEEGQVLIFCEYDQGENSRAYDLVQTEDGGYLLGGHLMQFNSGFRAVRVDAEGNEIWSREYGNFPQDACNTVLGLSNDRFILAGSATIGENKQAYIVKIEGDGDVIWEQTYGGEDSECFWDIVIVENGYALAGYTRSFGEGNFDFWLVRVNEEGELQWDQPYGSDLYEMAYSLVRTADNGFALSGKAGRLRSFFNGLLVRTDENGEFLWSQTFERGDDRSSYTCLNDISLMPDGGLTAVGYTTLEANRLGYVVCINEVGNLNWERGLICGEIGYNVFDSVLLDDDSGITMAGNAFINNRDAQEGWFVKLSPADLPPEIITKIPSDSLFRIPAGGIQEFSIVAIDPELQDFSYRWFFEGDTISDLNQVILEFPEYDTLALDVFASDGHWTVSTGWQIMVVPLITNWSPEDTMLTVDLDADVRFQVEHGMVEDTLVTFLWQLNDQIIGEVDAVTIHFSDVMDTNVTVRVTAQEVEESRSWHVRIIEPEMAGNTFSEPYRFQLEKPYPNPFNNTTEITFTLRNPGNVSLYILDLNGQEIAKLVNSSLTAGKYTTTWDAGDTSCGMYFVRLNAGGEERIGKLMLVR